MALASHRFTDSNGYSFLNYIDSSRRQTVNSKTQQEAITAAGSAKQSVPYTNMSKGRQGRRDCVRFQSLDATNVPESRELLLGELESVMSHVSIEKDEI